jgi:thioredoxin reductase (NADPH)
VEVRLNVEVTACHGSEHLERITVADRKVGTTEDIPARFVFVFIGAAPRTEWLRGTVALDRQGFVLTGPDLGPEHLADWPFEREPFLLEANVPGVFVAGDVRHESVKRVASAVGEGSVAVHFMHRYRAGL